MKKAITAILITLFALSLLGCTQETEAEMPASDSGIEEPSEPAVTALELTVEKITIGDNGDVTLDMKSEDSDEVNYIVYVTESTECEVNFETLEVGTELKVYADAILESYPMQVYPLKVTE